MQATLDAMNIEKKVNRIILNNSNEMWKTSHFFIPIILNFKRQDNTLQKGSLQFLGVIFTLTIKTKIYKIHVKWYNLNNKGKIWN
jgi:flagellar motor switch protein FliM